MATSGLVTLRVTATVKHQGNRGRLRPAPGPRPGVGPIGAAAERPPGERAVPDRVSLRLGPRHSRVLPGLARPHSRGTRTPAHDAAVRPVLEPREPPGRPGPGRAAPARDPA